MNRRGEAALGAAVAGVLAFAASLVIGVALAPFRDSVGLENVAILYMGVVAIAAVAGGPSAGVVAAVAAALSYNFFFTSPYQSLRVDSVGQVLTVLLLLVVGLAASLVRRFERRRSRRRVADNTLLDTLAVEVLRDALRARAAGTAPADTAVTSMRRLLDARWVAAVRLDPADPSARPLASAGDRPTDLDLAALPRLDERALESLADRAPTTAAAVLPDTGVLLTVGPSRPAYAIVPTRNQRTLTAPVRTALVTIAEELGS